MKESLQIQFKKEFTRDFEGNLEDPFDLCANYKLEGNTKQILFLQIHFLCKPGRIWITAIYEGEIAANDFMKK